MEESILFEIGLLIFLLILLRFFYLVHKITAGISGSTVRSSTLPARTIICMGSGGHTTEMLELIKQLDFKKYTPRYYIVANSDTTSVSKIKAVESQTDDYDMIRIPRSRVVGQSYITSIASTLYSIIYNIPIVIKIKPDLILCNGPGTCIPICVIAFLLKAIFVCNTRIVFIESFCRTKTFSLSGKILFYIADNILVQWPSLKKKLKRADYVGQLL